MQNKPTGGFTIIQNSMAQDKDLSLEARGLLLYLLSKPKGWKVRVDDIMKNCRVGRDKAYGLLNELIRVGYVIRRKIRTIGRYAKTVYQLFTEKRSPCPENQQIRLPFPEKPEKATNTPVPEKSDVVKPLPEKPHAYKINNNITTQNAWAGFVPNVCFSGFGKPSVENEAVPQPAASKGLAEPTERSEMDQRIDLMIEKGGQALSPKLKNLREKAFQALTYWLEQGCDFERDIIPAIVDRSYGQPPAKAGGWGYYDAAIAEAKAMRSTPMPLVVVPDDGLSAQPSPSRIDNRPAWVIEQEKIEREADAFMARKAEEIRLKEMRQAA